MSMEEFIRLLKSRVEAQEPDFGDGDSVLTLLYECFSELNRFDDERVKADLAALYRTMNGMTLSEMDQIIYPVSVLCRDHERAGFVQGIQIGIRLAKEAKL